jgi:hypothetical protein
VVLAILAELRASRCQRGRQGRLEWQGAQEAGGNRDPGLPLASSTLRNAAVLTGVHRPVEAQRQVQATPLRLRPCLATAPPMPTARQDKMSHRPKNHRPRGSRPTPVITRFRRLIPTIPGGAPADLGSSPTASGFAPFFLQLPLQ